MNIDQLKEGMKVIDVPNNREAEITSIGVAGVWLNEGRETERWADPNELELIMTEPKRTSPRQGKKTRKLNFSEALEHLKEGRVLSRKGWNHPNQWVGIVKPSEGSDMDLPYLYIKTAQDTIVPWLASQTDLLAEDWMLLARK